MLLIKRICDHLKRPFFEVMSYPLVEIEMWALSFHLDDNGAEDLIVKEDKKEATVDESVDAAKKFLYG